MSTTQIHERVQRAVAAIRAVDPRTPQIGVVLGSGLGPFAGTLESATSIAFADIPEHPSVAVAGHAGRLVIGELAGGSPESPTPTIAALAGRVHLYEGHAPERVVFSVRTLVALGVKVIVLTNAAGGVSAAMRPGDLVLITDHLNLQGQNPLVGPNDARLGERFPDVSNLYDAELRALALASANDVGIELREGVYAAMLGPSYETPAEIRMVRTLGADLVGMSTVLEAIAAHQMGARVLGVSCVTNLAAGVSRHPLSHAEVEQTARLAREKFVTLLSATLRAIAGRMA